MQTNSNIYSEYYIYMIIPLQVLNNSAVVLTVFNIISCMIL